MALSLAAFDMDDLAVIAAHLQEARLPLSQVVFQPGRMRFVMVFDRLCRESRDGSGARCVTGLHFERVLTARTIGFDPKEKTRELELFTVTFTTLDEPSGVVVLHFTGGEAIKLEVECLEALMRDLDGSVAGEADSGSATPDRGSGAEARDRA